MNFTGIVRLQTRSGVPHASLLIIVDWLSARSLLGCAQIFCWIYNRLQSGDAKCENRMKNSSLCLILAGLVWSLGACKSTPETITDPADLEVRQQDSAASAQEITEAAEPEPQASKVVMWVYKNHDTWSQVITNESRDIRGEESDSSRCQGAADVQYVGQCVNWSLSVPCETEGETWFYGGENAKTEGSICRSQSGLWTLKSPQSFQESGDCQLKVLNDDGAAMQEGQTFTIDCNWLSEDRMKKGTSAFSFGPVHQ